MLLNKRIILFLSDMMSGWRKQASGLVFARVNRGKFPSGKFSEYPKGHAWPAMLIIPDRDLTVLAAWNWKKRCWSVRESASGLKTPWLNSNKIVVKI